MRIIFCILFILISTLSAQSQEEEDLLSLLGEEEEITNYATAGFKTNRVINLHSIESTSGGVLDVKISHRFGFLNSGLYELFGLDAATIRIGGDYGITDNITVGIGRSSYEKTLDGFLKWRFLRQSTGKKNMPITAAVLATSAMTTIRMAINAEYVYVLNDPLAPGYRNSLSIGLDIETGGHVFQLHFTNSTSMIEKGYITETIGNWADGDIHFGFNVSRVFTVRKPKIHD